MDHKQRAKRYFEGMQLRVVGTMNEDGHKQVDKMFHHLFEAIKDDIKKSLEVESVCCVCQGRIVNRK
jgi:hypothetical protein